MKFSIKKFTKATLLALCINNNMLAVINEVKAAEKDKTTVFWLGDCHTTIIDRQYAPLLEQAAQLQRDELKHVITRAARGGKVLVLIEDADGPAPDDYPTTEIDTGLKTAKRYPGVLLGLMRELSGIPCLPIQVEVRHCLTFMGLGKILAMLEQIPQSTNNTHVRIDVRNAGGRPSVALWANLVRALLERCKRHAENTPHYPMPELGNVLDKMHTNLMRSSRILEDIYQEKPISGLMLNEVIVSIGEELSLLVDLEINQQVVAAHEQSDPHIPLTIVIVAGKNHTNHTFDWLCEYAGFCPNVTQQSEGDALLNIIREKRNGHISIAELLQEWDPSEDTDTETQSDDASSAFCKSAEHDVSTAEARLETNQVDNITDEEPQKRRRMN